MDIRKNCILMMQKIYIINHNTVVIRLNLPQQVHTVKVVVAVVKADQIAVEINIQIHIHQVAVVVIHQVIIREVRAHQAHPVQVAVMVKIHIAHNTRAHIMDQPHLICIHIRTVN